MRPADILLRCDACHEKLRAEVHVYDCSECGGIHPAPRTLTGDWLTRWVASHRDPVAYQL